MPYFKPWKLWPGKYIDVLRSDWSCGYCDTVVGFGAIDDVVNTLEKQIGDVSEKGHIAELEELLFHYSDLLHPNHYILASHNHNVFKKSCELFRL